MTFLYLVISLLLKLFMPHALPNMADFIESILLTDANGWVYWWIGFALVLFAELSVTSEP